MIQNAADQSSEHKLITELFDSQPDSVMWYIPKFSDDNKSVPIDFLVGYANSAACNVLKVTKHSLTGASLLSNTLIDEQTKKMFGSNVLKYGKQVIIKNLHTMFPVLKNIFVPKGANCKMVF